MTLEQEAERWAAPKASKQYCWCKWDENIPADPQTRVCPKAADLMKQVAR